jgi:hypothetical protein
MRKRWLKISFALLLGGRDVAQLPGTARFDAVDPPGPTGGEAA